jgi:heme-degrading monooxygenase HmoA
MKLTHILLLQPKSDTTDEAIEAAIAKVEALQQVIPGILSFESGKNLNPDNQGFTYAFVMHFESEEHLKAYIPHPDHQAAAIELRGLCSNVLVSDYTLPA